jgi:hypothetical protein
MQRKMAPYVSVTMTVYNEDPAKTSYVRLLLPIDALKHYDDPRAQWFWIPAENDAFDVSMWQITGNRVESSFRRRTGLERCVSRGHGVWDLR